MHFSNNNMGEYTSLNSRLQVCETSIGNGGGPGTLFNRQYFYGTDATSGNQCADAANNNGNILHVLDSMNSVNSQHYSYDDLDRLTQWKSGSGSNPTPRQSFGYDSFGNMVQAAGGAAPDPSSAFGSDNRFASSLFHCKDLSGNAVSYDSAGNQLCMGDPSTASQLYGFNEENELVLMWSQHLGYAYGLASQYSFDSSGQRVRADQWSTSPGETDWTILPASEHENWREYTYLNGQMLAEKDQNGHWTDYIYANGKRIARVQQVKPMLHIHGVRTQAGVNQGCGQNFWLNLGNLPNYTVRAGDRLAFSQNSTLARGGLGFHFSNDTWMAWEVLDQEGNPVNFGQGDGQWHSRIANLPQWAVGARIADVVVTTEHQTGIGTYDTWIGEAAIVSTDGSVMPLYHGQTVGAASWYNCDSNLGVASETIPVDGQVGSTYYATDQVGTAAMAFADDAWPIQRSEFAPFGQEITDPGLSDNRYKFPGKERDTESGLDYFGARFYGSSIGRWISPDWDSSPVAIPYADRTNPQSFNLYSYVGNNPLNRTDFDGHCTNGGRKQGFWWCLFNDSDQDAAKARQQLAQYKNVSINGKTPAEAAKGLSNTQTVQLERSVFGYISDQTMSRPGMVFALALVPGGAEEVVLTEAAAATESVSLVNLNRSLASQEQMGELIAGRGTVIAGAGSKSALRNVDSIVAKYGGEPGDWQKVASGNYNPRGIKGGSFEIHAYQNVKTGQVVEMKTKFQ